MLPHLCLIISEAYHAYAATLPSHALNLPSLYSNNYWLPNRGLFICKIDHLSTPLNIGFHNTTLEALQFSILMLMHPFLSISTTYHAYAPAPTSHILNLKSLCSQNDWLQH
ncbi:hypothetical protein O181_036029 [Austropuccinia psidii MF-1]|uniref:Uncharacterized protein n=1 Tax=Austropuccinia psidii MF-1 TaxID=1389203 RepID=A0A9Q3HB50_9BASI|nr:hypothetical protein [Austropuccinia psidii MF-1]